MGSLTIPGGGPVYLDTVALIYTVETVSPYAEMLKPLWQASRAGQLELITSEIALLEVLVGPMKTQNAPLVAAYEDVLSGTDLRMIPVDSSILRAAAQLRANTGARTPDAIHAATAVANGALSFITNDLSFRSMGIPGVQILNALLQGSR